MTRSSDATSLLSGLGHSKMVRQGASSCADAHQEVPSFRLTPSSLTSARRDDRGTFLLIRAPGGRGAVSGHEGPNAGSLVGAFLDAQEGAGTPNRLRISPLYRCTTRRVSNGHRAPFIHFYRYCLAVPCIRPGSLCACARDRGTDPGSRPLHLTPGYPHARGRICRRTPTVFSPA